jgi:hypothetical protein
MVGGIPWYQADGTSPLSWFFEMDRHCLEYLDPIPRLFFGSRQKTESLAPADGIAGPVAAPLAAAGWRAGGRSGWQQLPAGGKPARITMVGRRQGPPPANADSTKPCTTSSVCSPVSAVTG